MNYKPVPFVGTPAGSAGSAAVTIATERIVGRILGIDLDCTSQPATADITIRTKGAAGRPSRNLWVRSNSGADAYVQPRIAPVDNANAAIAANGTNEPYDVADIIEIVVAQGDPVANGVRGVIYVGD